MVTALPRVENSRRRLALRPAGIIFALGAIVVALNWSARRPGAVLVGVAMLTLLMTDLWLAMRSSRSFDLSLAPLEDGDVNDEIRIMISARHQGRSMMVSFAGASVLDRFVVSAPGTGILFFRLEQPGWFTHQDLDVQLVGPFGLVRCARRVRVPFSPTLIVGPPAFAHMYVPPPVRPVFKGPSPGSPKGSELTRGTRPYLPGDHRRSVHWKATAHMGALMVREQEGSGAVRIRVALVLHRTGPASVVTAGRANAFVRDFVGQGCEVELVTLESSGRTVTSLGRPYGAAPVERGVPPHHTVTTLVSDVTELRRRLAVVVVGPPELTESKIPTRIISDVGDQWV